ncbi:MAG: prolyl oligopeptidase family serine peptidase [Bacteroidales bacterium]|nr:prolyl oligopeptidase family serine peptidase [Bacteroidales bacterium]
MYKRFIPAAILCLLSIVYSCERTEDFDHLYLQDYKLLRAYTSSNIITSLQLLQTAYPDIASLAEHISYDVRVYSISYKTTFLGEEIIASGLVSIPDAEGSFPVISFQNGTNTCHSNAPSVNYNNALYSLLSVNAGNGFIIALPDYIGFGESEEYLHPYFHSESSNKAVRDMILAVEEFTDYFDGLNVNKQLYLMGYSQGGWATLTALKDIEQDPLEDYSLVSASCGAGAYNLIDFSHYIFTLETYPNPFYLPYYIESRIQNGMVDDPLDLFFKEPYASVIPGLFDGSLCNSELNSYLTNDISGLLTDHLLSDFDTSDDFISLRSELLASSVIPWKLNTPLMITHSNGDKSIPIQQSLDLCDNLIDAGTSENDLFILEINDLDHNDAIIPWGISTLIWFVN